MWSLAVVGASVAVMLRVDLQQQHGPHPEAGTLSGAIWIETGSHYVVLASLELGEIHLPLPLSAPPLPDSTASQLWPYIGIP